MERQQEDDLRRNVPAAPPTWKLLAAWKVRKFQRRWNRRISRFLTIVLLILVLYYLYLIKNEWYVVQTGARLVRQNAIHLWDVIIFWN